MDMIWYDIVSMTIDVFIYIIPFFLLYILYLYKLSSIKFEDTFFVSYELSKILKFHFFNLIFYIFYRVIIFIFGMKGIHGIHNNSDKNIGLFVMITLININMIFLMEFCTVYTSINWVRKVLEPLANAHESGYHNKFNNKQYEHMPLMSMTSSSYLSYINPDSSTTNILNEKGIKKPKSIKVKTKSKTKLKSKLNKKKGKSNLMEKKDKKYK